MSAGRASAVRAGTTMWPVSRCIHLSFLGQYRVYKHEPNGEIQLATLEAASSRGRVDLEHMRSHRRHTHGWMRVELLPTEAPWHIMF